MFHLLKKLTRICAGLVFFEKHFARVLKQSLAVLAKNKSVSTTFAEIRM